MNCIEMRKLYKESKKITENNSKKAADQIYDYVMRKMEEDFKEGNWYSSYTINVIPLVKAGITDFNTCNVHWENIRNLLVARFKSEHYLVTTYVNDSSRIELSGWAEDERWME